MRYRAARCWRVRPRTLLRALPALPAIGSCSRTRPDRASVGRRTGSYRVDRLSGREGSSTHFRVLVLRRCLRTCPRGAVAPEHSALRLHLCACAARPLSGARPALRPCSSAQCRSRDARIVLVHGGDVDVMRYAQLVRHASNALLDLSFTMVKYAGVPSHLDLKFLLKHLDRKICIGVDYPEFHHEQVRRRFEELTAGLGNTERENAGSVNLASLLGVEVVNPDETQDMLKMYDERLSRYGYSDLTLGWYKLKTRLRYHVLLTDRRLGSASSAARLGFRGVGSAACTNLHANSNSISATTASTSIQT